MSTGLSGRPVVDTLLESSIPLRLACNGRRGAPVLASLWFVHLRGRIWCASQDSSAIVRHLRRDPRCAFEISTEAPPYRGVRGQGRAALHPELGESILRMLLARYQGDLESDLARWLLSRVESEVAVSIEPGPLRSWDYSDRMD